MDYGSLFSGIEAATLSFNSLGWHPKWFAETDDFCCKVLKTHYPNVTNIGDVNNPDFARLAGKVDLIIGGSPCPSFSLAGKRSGIMDERGVLSLRYCQIISQIKPKWFIWENVPGVLTSNNGNDFKVILNEMVTSGYGVSWRVLDARCFGLPQSRKRLFVVGRFGEKCPPEILFEHRDSEDLICEYVHRVYPCEYQEMDAIPIALRGRENTRKYKTVMEFMKYFGCLRAIGGIGMGFVWDGIGIRRLTPVECERLMGMPDGYTNIKGATDRLRWKSIGNSMAVPVIKWIGQNISQSV